MSANTHWTQSRSVAAEGGGAEDPSQEQGSMADPPVRPEHDRGRSPTPSSDDYDEIEERGDDERAETTRGPCSVPSRLSRRSVASLPSTDR
ncbi:MAG: hypothetical protein M1816_007833 [Peltula sp. TS41687]|nr:MAG: hypothetical protein M1816_007833 [Peltula sp. TS41687]